MYGDATSAEQRRQWLDVLQAGGDAGQLRSLLHGGAFGGVVAAWGVSELVRLMLRRPWLLVPAAGLAAAAAARWTPARTAGLRTAGRHLRDGLGAVAVAQADAARRFQHACVPLPDWDALATELPSAAVLIRALMVDLARSPGGPSSAAELAERVWELPVPHGTTTVRSVLRSEACFALVSPGRWQLGAQPPLSVDPPQQ